MANKEGVYIDGVRYIPATEVKGIDIVLKALALQYHTENTLEEYGMDHLTIIVTDGESEGESFQDFAARLTELMRNENGK